MRVPKQKQEQATELHVPVAEERVAVEKRSLEIGEVLLRRTVSEERQTVALDVARETLRVTRRNVTPRPALPAEVEHAFAAGTRRVPVLGQRAVTAKRPFVTGEVVVHRSEEHTSELQSLAYLVCRLLLEKKKKK